MFALPDKLAGKGLLLRKSEAQDQPFLRALFGTARLDAQFLAQWPERDREAFLDSQFQFQDLHYRRAYAQGDFLVIERDGQPIGRLIVDRETPQWCLVDIALVPASRGQGFGTALLQALQAAAARDGAAAVTLHVEIGNPAQALYTRLGFEEIESESGAHAAMIWRPVS